MAYVKVSELTETTTLTDNDIFYTVDTETATSKKVKFSTLVDGVKDISTNTEQTVIEDTNMLPLYDGTEPKKATTKSIAEYTLKNGLGYFYLIGNESTNGSKRLTAALDGNVLVQVRTAGTWVTLGEFIV